MTRKTIFNLTTLLSCSLIAFSVCGCKDSESENASKDARDSISKSNRLVKSSSDSTVLTDAEMQKVAAISDDISSTRLKQERQQLAKLIANRLSATAGDSRFEEINAAIEALETSEINSQEDFDNICSQLVSITDEIIDISRSNEASIAASQAKKIDAALAELKVAAAAIRQSPSEDNRRSTLQAASSLSLAAIYASQAREEQEALTLKDMDIHSILMNLNTGVHMVRKANLEILAANSSRPDKALEGLNEQLSDAKLTVTEAQAKLETSKAEYSKYETEYNTNIKKANEYRNKYLQTLSKADKAEGAEKYKLEMEATIQRVGKENLKEWANKWLAESKDDEMEMYVNSSQDIIGGIHFETQAELAKLQMDSLETQINFYDTLINNTKGRIAQLEAYITKLMTSDDNTTGIENRITESSEAKDKLIADIKSNLEKLSACEAVHLNTMNTASELFQKAIESMEQYSNQARSFGEFDPENFTTLVTADLNRLHGADADFYNSVLTVLDNVRTLPELAENTLELSDDYKLKAQSAIDTMNELEPEVEEDTSAPADTIDVTDETVEPTEEPLQ